MAVCGAEPTPERPTDDECKRLYVAERGRSPHWTRHTHATHALARGAELTTVRDNLRHASIATTSIYLQSDGVKRARQMSQAFAAR